MHNGHEIVQVIHTLVELLHIIDSGVTIYGSSSLQVGYFPRSGFDFKSTWPIAANQKKILITSHKFSVSYPMTGSCV